MIFYIFSVLFYIVLCEWEDGPYVKDGARPCDPRMVMVEMSPNYPGYFKCTCTDTNHYGPKCSKTIQPGVYDWAVVPNGGNLNPGSILVFNAICKQFYYGKDCDRFCSDSQKTCGDLGSCTNDGYCQCRKVDMYGPKCANFCKPGISCFLPKTCNPDGKCVLPVPIQCPYGFYGPDCKTQCTPGSVPMTRDEYVESNGVLAYQFCDRVTGERRLCADPIKLPSYDDIKKIVDDEWGSSLRVYYFKKDPNGSLNPVLGGGTWINNRCECAFNWYGPFCSRFCSKDTCSVKLFIRQPSRTIEWCTDADSNKNCPGSVQITLPGTCDPKMPDVCRSTVSRPIYPGTVINVETDIWSFFDAYEDEAVQIYNRGIQRCNPNNLLYPSTKAFLLHEGPSFVENVEQIAPRYESICRESFAATNGLLAPLGIETMFGNTSIVIGMCFSATYMPFITEWTKYGATFPDPTKAYPVNLTFYNQEMQEKYANYSYVFKMPMYFMIRATWDWQRDIVYGEKCEKICYVSQCGRNGFCGMDGGCRCATGFYGKSCFCGPGVCQNDGVCDGGGWCNCLPGWSGNNCEIPIPFKCPDNYYLARPDDKTCETYCNRYDTCNGNGDCNPNGFCQCDPNWFSPDCSRNCDENTCNGRGVCDPNYGTCICTDGVHVSSSLSLSNKSRVSSEWRGLNCDCLDEMCGPNGRCVSSPDFCECDGEWLTDRSVARIESYCDKRCPKCHPSQSKACDLTTGRCICKIDPSTNEIYKGEGCDYSYTCFNGGIYNSVTYQCDCLYGWGGDRCEYRCDTDCGAGKCIKPNPDSQTTCTCPNDYSGPNCEFFCNPSKCNFDPFTNPSVCGDEGSCICAQGFAPPDCRFPCTDTENACGPHGQCDPDGGIPSQCVCDEGYVGELCDIRCDDRVQCNGAGKCRKDGQGCDCDPGKGGTFCERTQSPCQCINPAQGECTDSGKCLCAPGFVGERCDRACSRCTGGSCDYITGECMCDFGIDPQTLDCIDHQASGHDDILPIIIINPVSSCQNKTCPTNSHCLSGLCLCDYRRYPSNDCSLYCPPEKNLGTELYFISNHLLSYPSIYQKILILNIKSGTCALNRPEDPS